MAFLHSSRAKRPRPWRILLALPALLALAGPAAGGGSRPELAARGAEFHQVVPCPATGDVGRPCPGHEIVHIVPLCAGGPHLVSNMEWWPRAKAREKGQHDTQECRKARVAARAHPSHASPGAAGTAP